MNRLIGFDVFRGLLLLIMISNHTPSPLRPLSNQPLGFVSAAEGFVFISAFLCGMTFSRKLQISGPAAMKRLAWRRVGQIYLSHLLTLLFCFAVIGQLLGSHAPFYNMIHAYLDHPLFASISSLLLLYQPPLLDILPLYLVFLALSPLILEMSSRTGWLPIMGGSFLLWLLSQFGLKQWLLSFLGPNSLVIDLGAFNLLSWQLLWLGGLMLGQYKLLHPERLARVVERIPWQLALGIAVFFFCWRWPWIPVSVRLGDHAWLLDKWQLAPLRLLNVSVLVYLAIWLGPQINQALSYLKPLALLGRHMLPLFSLHVCFSLLAIGFVETYEIGDYWCYLILGLHMACIVGLSLLLDKRTAIPPGNSAPAQTLTS
ncbi:MAG: OpgC domain-containing protein [Gammaproteobacteria bacterium]|nr:OpgC domain-containing protein [Gammaproteobacteria bacterium]MCP5426106.1 OpgC domain-containing protein [Gammaproteobacteria bacterium]